MANASLAWGVYHSMSSFNVVLLVLYSFIVPVGLTLNALVILIVYKTKYMHTTTNYLLVNLAIADVVTLLFCPIPLVVNISAVGFTKEIRDPLCKFLTGNLLSEIGACGGFTCLLLLATERYHALIKPFKAGRRLTKQTVCNVIVFIWGFSVMFCAPVVLLSEYDETAAVCLSPFSIDKAPSVKGYIVVQVVSSGVVSLAICYSYFEILRGIYFNGAVLPPCASPTVVADLIARKKLAALSASVTLNFLVTYIPTLTVNLYLACKSPVELSRNYETLYSVREALRFLLYFSLSVNPMIYTFQSSNYRENLTRLLRFRASTNVHVTSRLRTGHVIAGGVAPLRAGENKESGEAISAKIKSKTTARVDASPLNET